MIDTEAMALPAAFEGPNPHHGHAHGHGHAAAGAAPAAGAAGAAAAPASAPAGGAAPAAAVTVVPAIVHTGARPRAGTAEAAGLETENAAEWATRVSALIASEPVPAPADAAAAAAAAPAPAPAMPAGTSLIPRTPASAAEMSARLWEAVQSRMARRVVYVAVFLYGESRERLKAHPATRPRFDVVHGDHVTVKHLPVRTDITRSLLDVVGLPVHLVTQRAYANSKRGVQAVTVGWPDFTPAVQPNSGRRDTRGASELMEDEIDAAVAASNAAAAGGAPAGATAAAAPAAAPADARLLHSPSLGPRPGAAAGGLPGLPSLTDLGGSAAASGVAAASTPSAGTTTATGTGSAPAAAPVSAGKQPQNARVRAALATIGRAGINMLSANRRPHVTVSVRAGLSPVAAVEMLREAARAEEGAANGTAAGSGSARGRSGSVASTGAPATGPAGATPAASPEHPVVGRDRAGSTASVGNAYTGKDAPQDVHVDLFGRVGLVVVDGPECRHRSYILNHGDLWSFLFRDARTAAAREAAAGGK
jgi:hypothetical protein